MKARANPARIGAFVIGAIALAVMAVVALGSGRLFADSVEMVGFFPGSVNGLSVGAPVKFKGVEIGHVNEILLAVDEVSREDFRIPVIFELDPAKLTRRGSALTAESLRDRAVLNELIESGLRAQLSAESFVTGVLYIELDVFPGTPFQMFLPADSPRREIPTLPTAIERAASAATQILSKIEELDLQGLFTKLTATVTEVNQLLASPELNNVAGNLNKVLQAADEAAEEVRKLANTARGNIDGVARSAQRTMDGATESLVVLDATLVEARGALDQVAQLVSPESAVVFQLSDTMRAMSDAARSLRRLADSLERNPSVLVRGRAQEEDPR